MDESEIGAEGDIKTLKETEKFIDSILSQTFFMMQVDFSRKILAKTNSYKLKERLESELKKISKEASAKYDKRVFKQHFSRK